jgi:hypothetical protein
MGRVYRVIPKKLEIQEKPLFGTEKRIGRTVFGPLASAAIGRNGRFVVFDPIPLFQPMPQGPIHEI